MIDEIIIYVSRSKKGAKKALKSLKRLRKQDEIAILASARVAVDADGVAEVTENEHRAEKAGAAFGAFAGGLFGAIGGPVGVALGASLGGLFGGAVTHEVEHELPDLVMAELREYLVPNASLLVAAIEKQFSAIVVDTLKELRSDDLDGIVVRRPVSVEENEALLALLA